MGESEEVTRGARYAEMLLQLALLVVLIVIAVMLGVMIRSENRQEQILIERYKLFHRIEERQAIFYNSRAFNLTERERARIQEINREAGIEVGQ